MNELFVSKLFNNSAIFCRSNKLLHENNLSILLRALSKVSDSMKKSVSRPNFRIIGF